MYPAVSRKWNSLKISIDQSLEIIHFRTTVIWGFSADVVPPGE